MKLLIPEYPLIVLPSLAKEIGLNEAIFLQQLHYWLVRSEHIHEGKQWVYNTYGDWFVQFPFWSIKTIKRIVWSLEKEGIVISDNFNKTKMDKTKWYCINYEKVPSLQQNIGLPSSQKVSSIVSKGIIHRDNLTPSLGQPDPIHSVKLTPPIPDTTIDITTEITTDTNIVLCKKNSIPYEAIIEDLNKTINANYKSSSEKTKDIIKARWNEGFRLEDFKTVHRKKSIEWGVDDKMRPFLRPLTLYGPKFESYLNQPEKLSHKQADRYFPSGKKMSKSDIEYSELLEREEKEEEERRKNEGL